MFTLRFIVLLLSILALIAGHACAQEPNVTQVTVKTITTEAGGNFVVEKTNGVDPRFEPVIARLVQEKGWDEAWVRQVFSDSNTVYIPKMVVVKPRKKVNSSGWYTWVNTHESAKACVLFINRYDSLLNAVEAQYGVEKETIAALLRCETRHGEVTGDYHVLSVYASMALMGQPENVEENVANAETQLKKEKKSAKAIKAEQDYIRSRSIKRGDWAFNELDNALKIHKSRKLDVTMLYGSWAGAFGWTQFLPSSYNRSAVDGDGDGIIDLYTPADAIHSVANYLSKAGYKSGSTKKMKKALRNYNPSTPYVDSIHGLAERVKKQQG